MIFACGQTIVERSAGGRDRLGSDWLCAIAVFVETFYSVRRTDGFQIIFFKSHSNLAAAVQCSFATCARVSCAAFAPFLSNSLACSACFTPVDETGYVFANELF